MRILVTGKGSSGSWKVRGEQLGKAMGAVVKPRATLSDMRKADVIVVVKRLTPQMLKDIRTSGKPWFWDVVDFYPQPECTNWGRSKTINWVKGRIAKANPTGVIWANARMQQDCGTTRPDCVIYHHHRPDIKTNPIRENVLKVGYEGSEKYLGKWLPVILEECNKRGWGFSVNWGEHADWDICLAFRDTPFNGYAQYHWKSNVKLANCQGSGTPFIGPTEYGYLETSQGSAVWANNQERLSAALDELTPQSARQAISEKLLSSAYTVEQAAADYLSFIHANTAGQPAPTEVVAAAL